MPCGRGRSMDDAQRSRMTNIRRRHHEAVVSKSGEGQESHRAPSSSAVDTSSGLRTVRATFGCPPINFCALVWFEQAPAHVRRQG